MKFIPEHYLRYVTAALFILFGIIFLTSAFLGVELF